MTEPDGRAGQEAARLLSAAQDWLRTSAPHLAPVGDDGEPCSCPLCKAVVGLREADPDAVARWVDAAVTGVSAALASVATSASERGAPSGGETEPAEDASYDASAGDDPAGDEVGHDGPGQDRVRRIRLDGDVGPDLP